MLADELDTYKEKGNIYVNDYIQEIQDLYKEEEAKKEEERIENEEVILIKPYKTSKITSTSSSAQTSFIMDKVKNLAKYMKFIQAPTQTRIFQPLPHYQAFKSKDEQDPEFFKEVAIALVDKKHNTKTVRIKKSGLSFFLFFFLIFTFFSIYFLFSIFST